MDRIASKTLFYLNDGNVGQVLRPTEGRMFAVGSNCFTITLVSDDVLFLSRWTSDSTDTDMYYELPHGQPLMIERDRLLYLSGPVPSADSNALHRYIPDAINTPPTLPFSRCLPFSPSFYPTSPSYSPASPCFYPTSPSYSPPSPYFSPTSSSNTPVSPFSNLTLRKDSASVLPVLRLEETASAEQQTAPRSLVTQAAAPYASFNKVDKKRRATTQFGTGIKRQAPLISKKSGFTVAFVMKFTPWCI